MPSVAKIEACVEQASRFTAKPLKRNPKPDLRKGCWDSAMMVHPVTARPLPFTVFSLRNSIPHYLT